GPQDSGRRSSRRGRGCQLRQHGAHQPRARRGRLRRCRTGRARRGYPWFGAWPRDTMIVYEGLFLCTGRATEGRALLRAYADTLSEGMLANTADVGHTAYKHRGYEAVVP